jgi:membrane protein YqaA with SNARE-associated domain
MASAAPTPDPPLPLAQPDSAGASEPERPVTDEELRDYIRRNLVTGMIALGALIGALAIIGRYFETELLLVTTTVYQHLGFGGLAAILGVTDSFISPIPPDLLLVVIAKSQLAETWWIVVPSLGVVSSISGLLGWAISRRVGGTRIPQLLFGRFQRYNAALVERYGTLAVALGAITPIPFSVTCWTAGMFRLPFERVAWVTLLRIPRFVGYYLLIQWSVNLF